MGNSPEKPKTGNVQVLERAFDLLEALAAIKRRKDGSEKE